MTKGPTVIRTGAATIALLLSTGPLRAQAIRDNSFLIEEGYNQEPGVVQHIATFQRAEGGDWWAFSFTQEWPLFGQRHQLSFTLPVADLADGTGLGDVGLNYRHQLVGGEGPVAFAPRLTILLPTGDEDSGHGTGAVGLQANLPLSVDLSPRFTAHVNLGATLTPQARSPLGDEAAAADLNLGASAIWHAFRKIDFLVEALWLSEAEVTGPGRTARDETVVFNPGLRWAHDIGGLQIVPGIGYPIALGDGTDERSLFLYLSFEHPFRHGDR
ncbi:MAG TPA: hypothetical protein VNK43_10605 [Gemmatimonadales bacterium]|nr:hypothetical protein [Gemmatimonadales bacterium]